MPWKKVKLVVEPKVRALCVHPYPNHPKGCPNFNKKRGCPPKVRLVGVHLDLDKDTYVVWNDFDLKAHVDKMRAKYPKWTDRQVECCLYWQPRARKQLKAIVAEFEDLFPGLRVIHTPEAQGVNLTETMRLVGVELEWPPKNVARQIVVAGTRKGTTSR